MHADLDSVGLRGVGVDECRRSNRIGGCALLPLRLVLIANRGEEREEVDLSLAYICPGLLMKHHAALKQSRYIWSHLFDVEHCPARRLEQDHPSRWPSWSRKGNALNRSNVVYVMEVLVIIATSVSLEQADEIVWPRNKGFQGKLRHKNLHSTHILTSTHTLTVTFRYRNVRTRSTNQALTISSRQTGPHTFESL